VSTDAIVASGLLIVVEAALARFVVAVPARARAVSPTGGWLAHIAATAAVKSAGRRRTGEIGTSVAHRAAVTRA